MYVKIFIFVIKICRNNVIRSILTVYDRKRFRFEKKINQYYNIDNKSRIRFFIASIIYIFTRILDLNYYNVYCLIQVV